MSCYQIPWKPGMKKWQRRLINRLNAGQTVHSTKPYEVAFLASLDAGTTSIDSVGTTPNSPATFAKYKNDTL